MMKITMATSLQKFAASKKKKKKGSSQFPQRLPYLQPAATPQLSLQFKCK